MTCQAHLYFDSSLEANTIRDGGLEVCYGVELFLNLRRDGRLWQVHTTWLWDVIEIQKGEVNDRVKWREKGGEEYKKRVNKSKYGIKQGEEKEQGKVAVEHRECAAEKSKGYRSPDRD